MAERKDAPIVDDQSVKDIYVNKLISAAFDGACVSITLGVARMLPTGEVDAHDEAPQVHVVARFALSPAAAVDLTKSLGKMLNTLKEMATKRLNEQRPH
jgi:hypothetical protein